MLHLFGLLFFIVLAVLVLRAIARLTPPRRTTGNIDGTATAFGRKLRA